MLTQKCQEDQLVEEVSAEISEICLTRYTKFNVNELGGLVSTHRRRKRCGFDPRGRTFYLHDL